MVPAGTWRIDPAHSSVGFEIKHMRIATVRGRSTAFEGPLEAEVDGAFKAHGTIATASIDTDDPKRDEHLRAPELFDIGGYPEITFVSSGLLSTGGSSCRMIGNLTIKGVTRPIALTVTVAEVRVDPWGHECVAPVAQGEIDRKKFGLTWSEALESGGVVVSNRVKIELNILAVQLPHGLPPDSPGTARACLPARLASQLGRGRRCQLR